MKFFKSSVAILMLTFAFAATAMAAETGQRPAATYIPSAWWIAPLASLAALVIAYIFYKRMMAAPEGS